MTEKEIAELKMWVEDAITKLGAVLDKLYDIAPLRTQSTVDWGDVGIGTTLLSKSSCSSMTNIDAVARVWKDGGIVPVYHLEGWGGWYTLDELKEKWWLVLPEEEKQ